jgi:hypothetical protein
MSDSDDNYTRVSFKRIKKGMMKILELKNKLTITFEKFADRINDLNSYNSLYNFHRLPPDNIKRKLKNSD